MGGWWTHHEFMVPGLGGRLQLLVLCWMHHFGILLTVCEPEIMIGALMYTNICSASSFHLINMSHARWLLSPFPHCVYISPFRCIVIYISILEIGYAQKVDTNALSTSTKILEVPIGEWKGHRRDNGMQSSHVPFIQDNDYTE